MGRRVSGGGGGGGVSRIFSPLLDGNYENDENHDGLT